jgi:uncharacterized protein YPO0396
MAKENTKAEAATSQNEVENISKIRDILFGNNMHEYEKRFEQLEQKLANSVQENRIEAEKKINALETFLRKELKMLNEKILEEESARIKSDKKIIAELEALEESLSKFKQSTADNFSEDREHFLQFSNSIGEQITELNKSLRERMEEISNQLQTNKVERSSLAMLFTEMAYNIAGEQNGEE